MNKFFDLIKETFKGKSIGRLLFNWQVYDHCQNLKGTIIDVGAGKNPSYYRYFKIKPSKFITVDLDPLKNPDVVADLNDPLPFQDNFADNVILFNVIYILKDPQKTLKEIHRILKKGGRLYLSSPFIFNESREPHDYYRFTSEGLENLLSTAGFNDYKLFPFGERFTGALALSEKIFIFPIFKVFPRMIALFLDKVYPKKLKKLHPCPMGYFVKAIK